MNYSIEPDNVVGRVHWTNLGESQVSTVRLSIRDTAPNVGEMLQALDSLLGRDGDYETAILSPDATQVVASADNPVGAEANHRRAVENLIDGISLTEVQPPLLRFLTDLEE